MKNKLLSLVLMVTILGTLFVGMVTAQAQENITAADGWTVRYTTGEYDGQSSFAGITTQESYTGDGSLHIKNSGSNQFYITPVLNSGLVPGNSYNVSFYIKPIGLSSAGLKVVAGPWTQETCRDLSEITPEYISKDGWEKYSFAVWGQQLYNYLEILIYGDVDFCLDNFSVTLNDTELISNGYFDVEEIEGGVMDCELYSIEFSDSTNGTIKGKEFTGGNSTVKISGIGSSPINVKSESDGSFSAKFKYSAKSYPVSVYVDDINILNFTMNLTNIPSLFINKNGYKINGIAIRNDGITVSGNQQSGTSGARVTFKATERGMSPDIPTYAKAVCQSGASSDGSFKLDFALEEGNYTGYIMCEGLNKYQQDFSVNGLSNLLKEGFSSVDKYNYDKLQEKLKGYTDELSALLSECSENGITTDYETLNYSVITKFAAYMEDEAAHGDYRRMSDYYKVFTRLYNEAKGNLNAYLSGRKEPLKVPKYVSGDITLDGKSLRATTFDGEKTEERPVFFVGYGHWDTPQSELEFFPTIGNNIIQMQGIAPLAPSYGAPIGENASELEREAAEMGFRIDYENIAAVKKILKKAADNNVIVSLNIHPNIPESVTDGDPTALEGGGQFIKFNVDNAKVRKYIELYARIIAHELKDCEGLFDLCLTNEPSVSAHNSTYFQAKWAVYLENLYGSISNLNNTYGSRYSSFSEVDMPAGVENTARFYDWRCFNDSFFVDFHNWFAGVIKEEAPNINVECKLMSYIDSLYAEDLVRGSDYEKIADSMDVNGCDATAQYNWTEQSLLIKMGWYDFMTSVKDAPVWNTEDHICGDGNVREIYNNEQIFYHTSADIWNGAVHGRGGSAIWIWDKGDGSMPWAEENGGWSNNNQNTNFVIRPAETAEIGKTTLDLNRLSNEITAIQKEAPRVGIVYSRTSSGYSDKHMQSLLEAYKSTVYSGQKVGFVTDSRPSDVNKYEVLIVPDATNVSSDLLNAVSGFVGNGGKLILIDTTSRFTTTKTSLTKDEHNKSHNTSIVNGIYNNANTTLVKSSVADTVANKIQQMSLSDVVLTDASTGETVTDVEWSYAEYNGNIVVNVINYDWDNVKNINVMYKGQKVNEFTELREAAVYGGNIAVKPYSPVLLEIKNPDGIYLDLTDENGNVLKSNIRSLMSGVIKLRTNTGGDRILALYKDGVSLEKVSLTGTIDIPKELNGNYSLEAMVWNLNSIEPLLNFVSIK